jgi:L,D-transpeptidase ErfK/SrfK
MRLLLLRPRPHSAPRRRECARRRWSHWWLAGVGLSIAAAAVSCTTLGTGPAPPAAVHEFALAPGQDAVGEVQQYVVRQGDVFPDIARRFGIGYTALAAANPGVDPWLPTAGRKITIPTLYVLPNAPHRGIVINLAQWRLFYFPPGGERVETYPVGLGIVGLTTPLGATRVVRKEPHPTWYPPPSIRAKEPGLPAVVPPGPDNPLGPFALRLGWADYLIHGTNKPDGVGRNVSHGCVRLYPEDITRLFAEVAVGTPVRTVSQPITAGWAGDHLYVEVYPSKAQTQDIDVERPVKFEPAHGVTAAVRAVAGKYADLVNWRAVEKAANERTGMPIVVADRSAQARHPDQPSTAARADASMGLPGPRHL